jgi:hypothetical protein
MADRCAVSSGIWCPACDREHPCGNQLPCEKHKEVPHAE